MLMLKLTLILLAGVVNVVVNDVDVFVKDEDCDRDHGGSGHPVRLEVWQGRGRSLRFTVVNRGTFRLLKVYEVPTTT